VLEHPPGMIVPLEAGRVFVYTFKHYNLFCQPFFNKNLAAPIHDGGCGD
jgi:hypothetical protein